MKSSFDITVKTFLLVCRQAGATSCYKRHIWLMKNNRVRLSDIPQLVSLYTLTEINIDNSITISSILIVLKCCCCLGVPNNISCSEFNSKWSNIEGQLLKIKLPWFVHFKNQKHSRVYTFFVPKRFFKFLYISNH